MSFVSTSFGRAAMALGPIVLGASLAIGCTDGVETSEADATRIEPIRPEPAPDVAGADRRSTAAAVPACVVEDEAGSCRFERCELQSSASEDYGGEEVEPLLSELEVPPLPIITAPRDELRAHPRNRDLVVAWGRTAGDAIVRVLLTNEPDVIAKTNAGRGPRFEYSITCDAPVEDGVVAIPSSLLEAFPETELDPALRVLARETYTVDDDGLDVTFQVGWFALTPAGREFDRTLKLDLR